jgi:hypothetical protein
MPNEIVYPSLNPDKNDGYLSIASLPDIANSPVQSAPFPKMVPSLDPDKNDGYPSFSGFTYPILVQTKPFPKMVPSLDPDKNDGYPSFSGFTYPILVQSAPFPKMVPSLEDDMNDGYPTLRHNIPGFGAFSNIPTLKKVVIPQTVKFITDYTFYNTDIKNVTIARDCVYFDHTFPPDCVISYYE